MAYWASTDASGCVMHLTNVDPADDAYTPWPTQVEASQAPFWHLTADGWAPRPALPAPVVTAGETLEMAWTGLPEGTAWEVFDDPVDYVIAEGVTDGDALVLGFDEAGVYRIELMPPKPFLPLTLKVTK